MISTSLLWLLGCGLFFCGERIAGAGNARLALDAIGLLLILTQVGLRVKGMSSPDALRSKAHKSGLVWSLVGLSTLLFYALTLDPVTTAMGYDESAAARWTGVFGTFVPIAWLVGTFPMVYIDIVLQRSPSAIPLNAVKESSNSALVIALAACLVFPVNLSLIHI